MSNNLIISKMAKKSKSKEYHFDIEITKPHSKEMYDHNDKVAKQMKATISKEWNELIKDMDPEDVWSEYWLKEFNVKVLWMQKSVMYSGFGDGYENGQINEEFNSELEIMQNWQLHEVYSDACHQGLVPKIKQGMVGHKIPFYVYYTDTMVSNKSSRKLDIIKEIGGDELKWINCCDSDDNHWKEPYIRVGNEDEGKSCVQSLKCNDIDAYVDCYEDDDGDEYPGGPPIILRRWTVKIKNY